MIYNYGFKMCKFHFLKQIDLIKTIGWYEFQNRTLREHKI